MRNRDPSVGEIAAEPLDAVEWAFLRRIEKLALALLSARFTSAQDLWQFQMNLLHLQRDIQASIKNYKSRAKHDKEVIEILTGLRICRWHSRRLGDAFAWVVTGGDKKILEPLSRNDHAAVTHDGHGSRGMLLAARYLAEQGWGFPLIHDITDCLRIGDITFVSVSEHSQRNYETVEIKTRAELKKRLEAENLAEYEYRIRVLSAESFDDPQIDVVTVVDTGLEHVASRPVGRRTGRQAKRMRTALLHQTAELNALLKEEGEVPALWTDVRAPVTTHWKTLQKVVRRARRSGYGSECVDGAFLYVAAYDANGLSAKLTADHRSRLQEDLSNPGPLAKASANVLSVSIIPPFESTGAHLFRPFYLYPIPRTSIIDLLYGRMIILVCFNEGRFVESLEEAGFDVDFKFKTKTRAMTVTRSMTAGGGSEYGVQFADLRYYFDEIIYEFRGLDAVVYAANSMTDAAVSAAPGLGS
ncbi:MAG TPA: hypothetical protein VFW50_32385 [Streptosporangiaceae bacterium]|nr:hypothetical protein [Streptosporangiaceae bacterium]